MKVCPVLDPIGDPTMGEVVDDINHLMGGYNGFENSKVGPRLVKSINNI